MKTGRRRVKEAEGPEDKWPIAVVHDRRSGYEMAHVLVKKGPRPYAIKRIEKDLEFLGRKELIMKCDQEPAITALREMVIAQSKYGVAVEESPVGESQSNGYVENAIRQMQGQIRTMKMH